MTLLTIAQAAAKLGVHISTLQRWEREGRLRPAFRTAGGHRRYSLDQIAQLKQGNK